MSANSEAEDYSGERGNKIDDRLIRVSKLIAR